MSNESNGVANGTPVATEAKLTTENSVEAPAPKSSVETILSASKMSEEEEDEDEDEEENLFAILEKEKEKEALEEAAHPHAPPTDIKAAPKLLQDALKSGAVKLNESSGGEAKAANGQSGVASVSSEKTEGEEKKNEDGDTKAVPAPLVPEKVSSALFSFVSVVWRLILFWF
jgi:hypothetical protein